MSTLFIRLPPLFFYLSLKDRVELKAAILSIVVFSIIGIVRDFNNSFVTVNSLGRYYSYSLG